MKSPISKAVILAGGKGSRLHPLTLEVPKPLITIRKRPLINYNLGLFSTYGVKEAKIIIRPQDREDYERWYREYTGELLPMRVELVEEREPMGTFGYIFHHLRGWVGSGDVFVSNGDEIKSIDLGAMAEFHRSLGLPATVALVTENERKDCGFVLVRENKIEEFLEKQENAPSNLMSAGLYLFSPAVFGLAAASIPGGKKFLMFETDLFPALAKERALAGFVSPGGKVFDCGTFERWEKAIREA